MEDKTPFGSVSHFIPTEKILLLPSNYATILKSGNIASIYGPHNNVWIIKNVEWILTVRPEIIKLIFGRASRFINSYFTTDRVRLLSLFDAIKTKEELHSLLIDARNSVAITSDEYDFVDWWQSSFKAPFPERYLERLCTRYAGEAPRNILRQAKLGSTILNYLHDSSSFYDGFSDQSHFIRMFKKTTGLTPRQVKKLSGTFYYAGTMSCNITLT